MHLPVRIVIGGNKQMVEEGISRQVYKIIALPLTTLCIKEKLLDDVCIDPIINNFINRETVKKTLKITVQLV